jgi:PPK2 family polyphosphate:nucleotide phosphotransferase
VREHWIVHPGHHVDLASMDAGSTHGAPGDHAATAAALPALTDRLRDLQDRLWAEARRSVLVILQAMDAGGKDGTIKHVFEGVNPQGTRVASFKEPTAKELAHDFLWRVHAVAPAGGEIAIFNRSQYEDVLVPRVHGQIDEPVWRHRYRLINGFEELLAHGGTTVVKLFLHISHDEQGVRLQERITQPQKRWKLQASDFSERAYWDAYQHAYADTIAATTTAGAPRYVIPSNHRWYRNWAVTTVLIETLEQLDPRYPNPPDLGSFAPPVTEVP